ncbi:MAG: hypothetical protein IH987_02890 [Planctomycetes bacterium]|nr:hypothetical protein [Planctomycetota bacterium]
MNLVLQAKWKSAPNTYLEQASKDKGTVLVLCMVCGSKKDGAEFPNVTEATKWASDFWTVKRQNYVNVLVPVLAALVPKVRISNDPEKRVTAIRHRREVLKAFWDRQVTVFEKGSRDTGGFRNFKDFRETYERLPAVARQVQGVAHASPDKATDWRRKLEESFARSAEKQTFPYWYDPRFLQQLVTPMFEWYEKAEPWEMD